MKPRSALKLAAALRILDWLLGFSVLTLFIHLSVDWFLPVDSNPWKVPSTEPVAKSEGVAEPAVLEDFDICWTARILEPAPPPKSPAKSRSAPVPDPPPTPPALVQLPFEWAGAIVGREPGDCYAILLDKRLRKQVLVRQGEFVPETDCRVVRVEVNKIHIDSGGAQAVVEPEKRRQKLDDSDPRIYWGDGGISIVDGAGLSRYGLRKGDRIVAVEGQGIESPARLRESLGRIDKASASVSVLREGRSLSLEMPLQATVGLAAGER